MITNGGLLGLASGLKSLRNDGVAAQDTIHLELVGIMANMNKINALGNKKN